MKEFQSATLPKFFRPIGQVDLKRLGRKYDGGYLVDARSIEKSDFLLSCGINDDWSFERQFTKIRPVGIAAYDPTVSPRWLLERIAEKPQYIFDRAPKYFDYFRFFKGNVCHLHKFVGHGPKDTHILLMEAFNQNAPSNAKLVFVKIDIEGSEYEILHELVALAPRISGLAIEFHDVDQKLELIEKFIKIFPLALCHTHINNYCWPSQRSCPDVLELSFTSCTVDRSVAPSQPHPLDMPNNRLAADVAIQYA